MPSHCLLLQLLEKSCQSLPNTAIGFRASVLGTPERSEWIHNASALCARSGHSRLLCRWVVIDQPAG